MDTADSIKLDIIDWLNSNLIANGDTKTNIARSLGVSKQAVTRWFAKGVISKKNLINLSAHFGTEPPLDLISIEPTTVRNPLAYPWSASARVVVGLMMEDQKSSKGRAKIDALLRIYDVVNEQRR